MKKISFIISFFVFFISISFGINLDKCEKKEFIVTAYYSPLKNQLFYYKDSFDKEIVLNGKGKYGASGKKVFNGMLAAPKNYKFGDIIYFPEFGIGEVADRGGAIVNAGERGFKSDRIDVWVGYGEEGLVRALDFGVKRISGYYCPKQKIKDDNFEIGFELVSIPIFENFFDIALWKQQLWPGRKDIWVFYLQKYLIKLGYLKDNLQTGYFGKKTKNALCKYQTDKLISYPSHIHCGVFGKSTRFAMKNDIENQKLLPKNLWALTSIEQLKNNSKKWSKAEKIKKQLEKNKETKKFDKPFYLNTYNQKVLDLQKILIDIGLYSGELDGVFDKNTKNALYKYQLKKGILDGNDGKLAGYFGPQTRKSMNQELKKIEESKKMEVLESIMKEELEKKQENKFQFYRPYKKGEGPNEEVRILQRFLKKIGLFEHEVNGVYDKITIDSLYDFQLKYGLLDEDSHFTLKGYLGPKTRDRINRML